MQIRDLISELQELIGRGVTGQGMKVTLKIRTVRSGGEVDFHEADDFEVKLNRGSIILDGVGEPSND